MAKSCFNRHNDSRFPTINDVKKAGGGSTSFGHNRRLPNESVEQLDQEKGQNELIDSTQLRAEIRLQSLKSKKLLLFLNEL